MRAESTPAVCTHCRGGHTDGLPCTRLGPHTDHDGHTHEPTSGTPDTPKEEM